MLFLEISLNALRNMVFPVPALPVKKDILPLSEDQLQALAKCLIVVVEGDSVNDHRIQIWNHQASSWYTIRYDATQDSVSTQLHPRLIFGRILFERTTAPPPQHAE